MLNKLSIKNLTLTIYPPIIFDRQLFITYQKLLTIKTDLPSMKHQLFTLYNQALIMYRQETTMYQQLSTDRSQCTADMPSTSTTYPGHKTSAPLFLDLRPSYCKKHGRVKGLVPKGSVSSGLPYYVQHFTTAFPQDCMLSKVKGVSKAWVPNYL